MSLVLYARGVYDADVNDSLILEPDNKDGYIVMKLPVQRIKSAVDLVNERLMSLNRSASVEGCVAWIMNCGITEDKALRDKEI